MPYTDSRPGRPLVLVVDHDAGHRMRVSETLRNLGWRVRAVAHPDDAERVFDDYGGEVRAVLMDLEQPGLIGGRALAGWGEARPGVVRCGMARVTPHLATVLGRMSGIPVFTKPLDPAESDRQLRTMLDEANRGPIRH
jgi:DNA-binding response OmpR family regulator